MKIFKKSFVFLLTLIICITVPLSVFAQSTVKTDTQIQYFDDGSYIVTETTQNIAPFSSGTNSLTRTSVYFNSDDEALWTVSLTGRFTYTGSSATCTSATTSYKIYDNAWKVTEATPSKSGRTASAYFVVKKYWIGIITKTVPVQIVLTCDNNGNIS